MTKHLRQLYFGLILAVSAIILGYTLITVTGYTINWRNGRLEATGALSLDSLPAEATISIPEAHITATTPKLIQHLLPGSYQVSVTLTGHNTWHDTVTIEPRRTEFLHNIVLFQNQTAPEQIDEVPDIADVPAPLLSTLPATTQYTISQLPISDQFSIMGQSGRHVVLYDKGRRVLYDVVDTVSTLLSSDVIAADWDSTSATIVLVSKYELKTWEAASGQFRTLQRQSAPFSEVSWFDNGHYILTVSNGTITALETRLTNSPNITILYEGTNPRKLTINATTHELYFIDGGQWYHLVLL